MNDLEISQKEIQFFKENGYLVIENLIEAETIEEYKKIYKLIK